MHGVVSNGISFLRSIFKIKRQIGRGANQILQNTHTSARAHARTHTNGLCPGYMIIFAVEAV